MYIYRQNTERGGVWSFALKKKLGYEIIDPFAGSLNVHSNVILRFEYLNFDGRKNPELILKWEYRNTVPDLKDNIKQVEKGLQIWDLDRMRRLADFVYYSNYENTWTQKKDDPARTETVVADGVGGSVILCTAYVLTLERRSLLLTQTDDCGSGSPENFKPLLSIAYKLKKRGLVRVN